MTNDRRRKLRHLYIGIGVVGVVGLVASYNFIGYLFFRFESGWEGSGMDPAYLGRYGGVLGRLLPLAFAFVVILCVALMVYLLSKEEQLRATAKPTRPCPECSREIESDWPVCPYCRANIPLVEKGTDTE